MVFVDVGENLVMVDDVVTPLNLVVAPVEEEELEKTSFDVNVSQWSHDEEPFEKVVHIQADHLTWDRQLSSNSHVLVIY